MVDLNQLDVTYYERFKSLFIIDKIFYVHKNKLNTFLVCKSQYIYIKVILKLQLNTH